MKKLIPFVMLFLGMFITYSFVAPEKKTDFDSNVKWYSWEEAVAANKKVKKKFMVDVYTEWCGWCKRMDKATFDQANVAAYLNKNFYPVKMDAEMKNDIVFDGHTFNFIPNAGRRGIHTLAYSLLDGALSYPSIVFLDENVERIMVSKGYKGPEDFIKELEYTAGDHYTKTTLEQYKAGKAE